MKKLNVFSLLLAIFSAFTLNAQSVKVSLPQMNVDPGQWFSVDVKASDFDNMVGMQYLLEWDPTIIQFQSVSGLNTNLPDFTVISNFNISSTNEGRLKMLWFWFDAVLNVGVTLDDNSTLFKVNFKAVGEKGSSTSIDITEDTTIVPPFFLEFTNFNQEVNADIDNGKVTINGVSASEESFTNDFTLFQNSPNPFSEITYISFNLNTATDAKLTIYDNSGKVVYQQNKKFPAGNSRIPVRRDMLASAGSYFYTLETARATATRQLIMQ